MSEQENTTLERVLTIAPELENKVYNLAQVDRINVLEAEYDVEYKITINETEYTITSPDEESSTDLLQEIVDLLVIEVGTNEDVYTSKWNDSIELKAVEPGTGFNISVSNNLVITEAVKNYQGAVLFELLLEDVILQVTELNFHEEMERAQRYLLAHLLTLTNIDSDKKPNLSDIIHEVVGDISYRYGNIDYSKLDDVFYGKSVYGVVFYEIMKRRWFRFI
jgi:hypothetical protein